MGIAVMLNNFFHDFAVALLFACLIVLYFIERSASRDGDASIGRFYASLYRSLQRVILFCWAFIIAGGVFRTITYREYEWMEAAGRGQILALVIKHLLLVTLVVLGTIIQLRLRKRFPRTGEKHT